MEGSLLDHLTSGIEKVVIFTDCEPDDIIALTSILPKLNGKCISIIVSCWADPIVKARFLKEYLSVFNVPVAIFTGVFTDKQYNMSSLVGNHDEYIPSWVNQESIGWDQDIFILQLAPLYELMELYQHDNIIFNNKNMALYASFNVRHVMGEYSPKLVTEMIQSFRKVIYYETYYATDPTIMTDMTLINQMIDKYPAINPVIKWWNAVIRDEIKDKTDETSRKILDSIDNYPLQFVHADTGLVATLLLSISDVKEHMYTGTLHFSERTYYSIFDNIQLSDDESKIILITGDKKALYDKHVGRLRQDYS